MGTNSYTNLFFDGFPHS